MSLIKMEVNSIQKIEPIKLDFSNLRKLRQKSNDIQVYEDIMKGGESIKKLCNMNELQRVLEDVSISLDDLIKECKENKILAKILAGRISKNATRQGSSEEQIQLSTCNLITSKFGINIEKLSPTSFRPTKTGEIINYEAYKKCDKNTCLKSFDAKISGKKNGWIFAKIVYGSGGHQDNVFEEAYTFCEWAVKYGKEDELYVVLIDTDKVDEFDALKKKFHYGHILVVNHVDFQQYAIDGRQFQTLN